MSKKKKSHCSKSGLLDQLCSKKTSPKNAGGGSKGGATLRRSVTKLNALRKLAGTPHNNTNRLETERNLLTEAEEEPIDTSLDSSRRRQVRFNEPASSTNSQSARSPKGNLSFRSSTHSLKSDTSAKEAAKKFKKLQEKTERMFFETKNLKFYNSCIDYFRLFIPEFFDRNYTKRDLF